MKKRKMDMLKNLLTRLMVLAAVVVAGFCAAPGGAKEDAWQMVGRPIGGLHIPEEGARKTRIPRVPRRNWKPVPAEWLGFKIASKLAPAEDGVDAV